MKIAFRADASLVMGSGHVMRCLTLAHALREAGHRCVFLSREHQGNLNSFILEQGFELHSLPVGRQQGSDLYHSHWLGASQDEDAQVCRPTIEAFLPDWLVVDHYALDWRWESTVARGNCRVLVIDDLADRSHQCDVLLDQNFGRQVVDYRLRVPEHCQVLVGPGNALLRPEFAELRNASLTRRAGASLREVLISLGGVDQDNVTSSILSALKSCKLPEVIRFTVVMGASAPHLAAVREMASTCPWPVELLCGISDMAQRMAAADLAIGASGGTSWERCCLGLPTLLVILAKNQKPAGLALNAMGAVQLINLEMSLEGQLQSLFDRLGGGGLQPMVAAASQIVDGLGVDRVLKAMEAQR